MSDMEWNRLKDSPPPKTPILVYGLCGMIDVVDYANGRYYHPKCCFGDGAHYSGAEIDFTHWMELPKLPKKEK